jgi:hypothetical protein
VPDDFVVAVKASRYLTHYKRLRPEEPVGRLLRARNCWASTSARCWCGSRPRLPAGFGSSARRCVRRLVRIAVEPRHPSVLTTCEPSRATMPRCASRTAADPIRPCGGRRHGATCFHEGRAAPDPATDPMRCGVGAARRRTVAGSTDTHISTMTPWLCGTQRDRVRARARSGVAVTGARCAKPVGQLGRSRSTSAGLSVR